VGVYHRYGREITEGWVIHEDQYTAEEFFLPAIPTPAGRLREAVRPAAPRR
jgi:hypothetical protein